MTESTPAHHTAECWAGRPRHIETSTIKRLTDHGERYEITGSSGWTFLRSKADIGRELHEGDVYDLETCWGSNITGMRMDGIWLFHLSDEDLAQKARDDSAGYELRLSEELDRNHRKYSQWEAELPEWLKARIQRFHDAAGDKFKREGWGYELVICRLADLHDQGRTEDADALAKELGASGNQWDCAKALADLRAREGDGVGVLLPAGLSPITGSADYS
jgi:hypothetical protein